MNEQIKAIRAEIERRMEKHWDLLPDADSPEDDWTHNEFAELGAYKELEHLETFVDSLPEETDNEEPNRPKLSDTLEEAAEKYAKQYAKETKPKDADGEIWKVGDVMIENQMSFEDAFKAGAEWMAGQGVIKETQVYANRWTDADEVIVNLGRGEYGFKAGDKVIVQIRKNNPSKD